MISPAVKRRVKKLLLWVEILFILTLGAGMGVVLGVYYQMNKTLPPDSRLDHYKAPVGTSIYSSDGVLLARFAAENREPVSLDQISPNMQHAIVAIEDARFYSHSGLDYIGLTRSLWANVRGQEMAQGGSTITQQLARNMFLSKRKKISRKIREMMMAVQIERNWTKRQILEAYLNEVYFGAGAYGVESASKVYFDKHAKDLTVPEAAMIAGLVQRPNYLSPYIAYRADQNYDRTKGRRNMVLDRMADLKFITPEEAEKFKATPVKVQKERPRSMGYFRAKYFSAYVMDQLRDQLKYDQDMIDKAGLQVVTSLNYKMQKAAEQVCKEQLGKIRHSHHVSDVALVCLDPRTGYIRAMVGGVNEPWEKYQFNCATQARRQPGSSFKAFVYANAFENGDTPDTGVNANAAVRMPDGKVYTPHNHGHTAGYMNYREAFAQSVNGAAVNVAVKQGIFEGPRHIKALAQRLGLTGDMRAYPSIALGTSEATPLEMADAYATFAAKGKRPIPISIVQVRSREGEILQDVQPQFVDSGLKPETIEYMDDITRAVVEHGTGTYARKVPDAHGKTGTTEDYTNAWFLGYTGDLATSVWAGNRNNTPMRNVYGATIAVPIWADFMAQAEEINHSKQGKVAVAKAQAKAKAKKKPATEHPKANTTTVTSYPGTADASEENQIRATICPESGQLATAYCPNPVTRYFANGEQPMTHCTLHAAPPKKKTHKAKQKPPEEQAGGDTPPADGNGNQ